MSPLVAGWGVRGARAVREGTGRSRCWPERLPQPGPGHAPSGAGQGRDRGHGERWAMAEGEEGQRGYREGIFAGRFPLSLPAPGRAFPGTPGVLGRAGPGEVPRCARSSRLHPARCPPAPGETKILVITKIQKHISDTMGCYFATVQKALKSLCAGEQ